MTRHWPKQQGMFLNTEVASLFNKIHLKFNYCLYNYTKTILSFDIINPTAKKELFKIIVLELEILILDIIDLDLHILDIKILSLKIFIDLLNKSTNSFCKYVLHKNNKLYKFPYYTYLLNSNVFSDKHLLLEELLIYLVFGVNGHYQDNYQYLYKKIPFKYIEILLDNFVIQLGHTIFYQFIYAHKPLSRLILFLKSNQLHNDKYISIKSLIGFKNNLKLQHVIDYYFIKPQSIYNSYYVVWFFNTQGLINKYIFYTYGEKDINNLSTTQVLIISFLELQDFLYPKICQGISIILQIITYICTYFLEKAFSLLLLRVIKIVTSKTVK